MEYMILSSAGIFDPQHKTFVSTLMPGHSYNYTDGKMAGFQEVGAQVFEFSEKMARLNLTKEEKSLLYAICMLTAGK